MGLRGGLNLYAYAPNPLKYIDPLGLCKAELPSGSNTIKRADGSELIQGKIT
ncbi:hypothetical protein [Escherichia coli]|uniref:hypothetical protein n=1 Tax=Escherichia coli TaxID=562 RepID=UPI002867D48C|nr:hypothetical protein [Escherichia coli]MEC9910727.1 hypothetical protein [Escherichia coli]MED0293426.1 hypothetical protein [Escherichia coli]MED0337459.1 hypothetical protein [Escherichia coli]MED8801197.1 hypothetical protein [Escherichia coli]